MLRAALVATSLVAFAFALVPSAQGASLTGCAGLLSEWAQDDVQGGPPPHDADACDVLGRPHECVCEISCAVEKEPAKP